MLAEISPALTGRESLVISIAAGLRTASLAQQLPAGTRVVRVMPNTPCVVGEMAAGFCLGHGSGGTERAMVKTLLSGCG
eukprot:SAG31_NODE_11320_length_1042_cov_1.340403_2_plen_78_part_01